MVGSEEGGVESLGESERRWEWDWRREGGEGGVEDWVEGGEVGEVGC